MRREKMLKIPILRRSSTQFRSSHPITSADFCVFHQRSKEKTRQIRSESAEKWKIVKGIVPGSH